MPLDPLQRRLDREAAAQRKKDNPPPLDPPWPFTATPEFDPFFFDLQKDPPQTTTRSPQ